jgi:tetratricopeptide (TPR) repeat protein
VVLAVSLVLLSLGCARRQVYMAYLPPVPVDDKPAELQPGYRALNAEGARNYVLNQLEIGIDAFLLDRDDLAAAALDAALDAIESVYGNDENARKARKLWHEEGRKTFKGEPYERAMAYYYRGLLFIREGDLENARACFRAGLSQDAFVEEEQHRSDFASVLYLEAWCCLQLGDRSGAEDALRFFRELRPDCEWPSAGANILVVGESGTAPRKRAEGSGGSELHYYRGSGPRADSVVLLGLTGAEQGVELYPVEDVYWQASTRGGRPVDHLLAGKAVFKENWDQAGSAMTQAGLTGILIGSTMSSSSARDTTALVSGAVMGIGLLTKGFAGLVRPDADTRRVRNLPDTLLVTAVACEPGRHQLTLEFADADGRPLERIEMEVLVTGDPPAPGLVYGRYPVQIVSGRYVSQ